MKPLPSRPSPGGGRKGALLRILKALGVFALGFWAGCFFTGFISGLGVLP